MKKANMDDFKQGKPKQGITLKANKVRLRQFTKTKFGTYIKKFKDFQPSKELFWQLP